MVRNSQNENPFSNESGFSFCIIKFSLFNIHHSFSVKDDCVSDRLFQLYSPYGELYAPSVRDICFASDMPAGVRGEYNITETAGFNITFCTGKIFHSVEDGISLKS